MDLFGVEKVEEVVKKPLKTRLGKKELIAINADVAPDVPLTDDDWLDLNGEPLFEYISKVTTTEYRCPAKRRKELNEVKFWKDEYLRYLYNHMKSGKSYESFGGRYGITNSKKKLWDAMIVEWRLVKDLGWLVCREKWEDMGIEIADGTLDKGNASVYNTTMKALFETYKDKLQVGHQHTHSGKLTLNIVAHTGGPELLDEKDNIIEAEVIDE